MSSPEEELIPILQQMSAFHLKWIALNDKCKALRSSLTEANSKNEELEIKVSRCSEQIAQKEEENKKLISIIKKLRRKFQSGSVHKLIDALKKNIRVYDETVLPSVSELTKDFTSNLDTDNSSGDENDPKSPLCVNNITSKLVNQVQNYRSQVVIEPNNENNMVTKSTPTTSIASVPKTPSILTAMLKAPIPNRTENIENISITDASCDSKISSSCVSSTTLPSNDMSTEHGTGTDRIAVTRPKISDVPKPVEKNKKACFIEASTIESLWLIEEQIVEEKEGSAVNAESASEPSLSSKSSSNQKQVNEEISVQEDCDEKPDVLMILPPMLVTSISKIDDISCEMIDVDASVPKPNQPNRLKRPCSPSSISEPGPKRSTMEKSSSCAKSLNFGGSAKSDTDVRCLICEYEDIDGDKSFKTYLALDDHIIEKHPEPYPPYKRCMFNNGHCTRHFHPKQNFHKHVKRAHSLQDPVLQSDTNQEKPLKCCGKLFLFQSDLVEHGAQVHGTASTKKRIIRNVCRKKTAEQPQSTWVRPTAECEVCKKDNRPNVKYKLYDELDAHITKCHADPFPEYFRCPYCIKRHFRNVKWLTSHIIKKHPDEYSRSPLEKFLPSEMLQGNDELMIINDTSTLAGGSSSSSCPLRILSPHSINKAISTAVVTGLPPWS